VKRRKRIDLKIGVFLAKLGKHPAGSVTSSVIWSVIRCEALGRSAFFIFLSPLSGMSKRELRFRLDWTRETTLELPAERGSPNLQCVAP